MNDGNVVHCPCGRSYRFRREHAGQAVLEYGRRFPWSKPAWRFWGVWPSTIEKFRCRCGKNLRLSDHR